MARQSLARALGPLGFVLACALVLLATRASSESSPAPAALLESDIGSRLRVFAEPGDYKLENSEVTAVIRRRDGWLTEFWRNRAHLPTVDQLGTLTEIDGLWQFHPVVFEPATRTVYTLRASEVRAERNAITTRAAVEIQGARVEITTRYELDATRARLRIRSSVSASGHEPKQAFWLGDAVRWGNVQYYVEGVRDRRWNFKGSARWIGRRGAGGDLQLSATSPARFWIEYESGLRGFSGGIYAYFHRGTLPQEDVATFERELAYAPLPKRREVPVAKGTLLARVVDEGGARLPAKLTVRRVASNKPIFDLDGDLDGTEHFLWTGNGELSRDLPVGRYHVLVTSGIERGAVETQIAIRKNQSASVEARLDRVIQTPGWTAADLHLHQAPSVDADVSLENRVISIAAEGIEFAVATDHYVVTDLAPTVRELLAEGILTRPLQTMAGSEVSTLGNRFGHFNVFPLSPGRRIEFRDTTPTRLFDSARRASPNGVLQVNHPRWNEKVGYFTFFSMDAETGEVKTAGYDARFDTIEVYNGADAHDLASVRQVLADFLHLLGRGHRYAATGSSDSHKLAFLDPGLPRTMIFSGEHDDAKDVQAPPAKLLSALKAGRASVTSGPFIDLFIDGKGPGERVRARNGKARVELRVRAAPWIDVSHVEILVGARAEPFARIPVGSSRSVIRLEQTLELPVAEPTFVVAVAEGQRPLPHASDPKVRPFAFTNPIWIKP